MALGIADGTIYHRNLLISCHSPSSSSLGTAPQRTAPPDGQPRSTRGETCSKQDHPSVDTFNEAQIDQRANDPIANYQSQDAEAAGSTLGKSSCIV